MKYTYYLFVIRQMFNICLFCVQLCISLFSKSVTGKKHFVIRHFFTLYDITLAMEGISIHIIKCTIILLLPGLLHLRSSFVQDF